MNFSGRSDPTENDSVEGLRPNARGPGLVTFGVGTSLILFFSQEQLQILIILDLNVVYQFVGII